MLLIFDCDGVLVDSEAIAIPLMAEHFDRAGFPASAEDMFERFAGFTDEAIFATFEKENGRKLPAGFAEEYVQDLEKRLSGVPAMEGIHELLDRLEIPRCVCSNSPSNRLKIMLGATGLYDRFRPYVFSARDTETTRPKPAPDIYLHAARQLETDPADTIVIEDSVPGVTGAVAAGMRVIGFAGASHVLPGHADALSEAGAETVIRRLADVAPVVEAFSVWRDPR